MSRKGGDTETRCDEMAGYVSPLIGRDYWEAGGKGADKTYGAAGQAKFQAIAGGPAIDGVTGEKGYKGKWNPSEKSSRGKRSN